MDPDSMASPADVLASMVDALGRFSVAMSDGERIDCLRQFENLRGAVVAAQARLTSAFVDSQCADQRARGVPSSRIGRGVASQVGLARRVSPFAAARWVGFARRVATELPGVFDELAAGRTTEWRATLVARETAWLSRDDRAEVDKIVAPRLGEWGDKRVADETRKAAYTLDPDGYVEHLRKVADERHVSLRPEPDLMTRLSALLPLPQGVAVYAALGRAADEVIAAGDPRSRAQVMADTLVERCTGQQAADGVAAEVQLIMPADVLLGHSVGNTGHIVRGTATRDRRPGRRRRTRDRRAESAILLGYGPLPAAIARSFVLDRDELAPTWIRRLYQCPDTGELVAMESRRRTFTAGQRAFIKARDQRCRTPFCDAPIRHVDHVTAWDDGGRTEVGNGDGLCASCNWAKQAPGWLTDTAGSGLSPGIIVRTPTGHHYRSEAPALDITALRAPIGVDLDAA